VKLHYNTPLAGEAVRLTTPCLHTFAAFENVFRFIIAKRLTMLFV